MQEPLLFSARDLSVRYATGRAALDGINFEMRSGEFVALVGANGAGKSTLIRALLGLLPVTSGHADFRGRASGEWPRAAMAQEVGVLMQNESTVFPIQVSEMVGMGRYAYLGPFSPPTQDDRGAVERAMRQCDIVEFAHRTVDSLSGGELQRVRLARALAQEPSVLVLDEPTTALDLRHEIELFQLLAELRAAGKAVLVATHELNLAARFASRLVLMKQGAVEADGPTAEVMTVDNLSRAYECEIEIVRDSAGNPLVSPRSL